MEKIGFVGMGNMAKAIAAGFSASGKVLKTDMLAYAPNQEKLKKNALEIGFVPCASLQSLLEKSSIVIIACKPHQVESVLFEGADRFKGKVIVSVAAGWSHEAFLRILGSGAKVQCVMPNTPAMVGEGVLLFEKEHSLEAQERETVKDLFSSLGIVEELPAGLMGIGGAVSGCGPAFMDLIMESYADAAVKYGISRDMAYRLVAQTMAGSARLLQRTGAHPGALKDAVCSPGGTTIRGVDALEKNGLRAACISSIDAIMEFKKG